MPRKVVKRKGGEEPFVPEKIVAAAVKSGADPETARAIARDIEQLDEDAIETSEIRERVLQKLRAHDPEWEKQWRSYDKGVKRLYHRFRDGLYE
ncbi:MAG: ATP cone domain-containing protein [Thermoplasmatota archaeon]